MAEVFDDSLVVTCDWLFPAKTSFWHNLFSTPIKDLDEEKDVEQYHQQEAASEALDNGQEFEPGVDKDEEVDKVDEEDTLHPFWADPILRAGTFDTSASQEERTPCFREMLQEPKPPQKPKNSIP
ncbi:hypothetical protein R1flu_017036 [Riccia fluitans]|uniref:Uncharacterized protein n=1 Tax=Riccia fluitans TaxID=41844 RepID=A0ABD1YPD0_9MARC